MSADWDRQVENEKPRYRAQLGSLAYLADKDDNLKIIMNAVITSAANASLNAGYSGSHSDGGASNSVSQFRNFLEGYAFGKGDKAGGYQHILDKHVREQDPEYQEYLRLEAKFGKK